MIQQEKNSRSIFRYGRHLFIDHPRLRLRNRKTFFTYVRSHRRGRFRAMEITKAFGKFERRVQVFRVCSGVEETVFNI